MDSSNAEDFAPENFESEAKSSGCRLSKLHIIIIAVSASVVILLAIILGLVFGLKKTKSNPPNQEINMYIPKYKTITKVQYYSEIIGTTQPNKPVKSIKNEGYYTKYPTYGSTLREVIGSEDFKVDARNRIITESTYLAAGLSKEPKEEQYSWMDENGFLYQGTVTNPKKSKKKTYEGKILNEQRQLYQHNASVGLYLGNISDDEPRIIKKVVLHPRFYRCYSVTGLYAPPGEVIKIEISKEDMESSEGYTVHIGQALFNGQANNIWTAKNQMQRFPIILTTFNVNKGTSYFNNQTNVYTSYVGSFVGGPIYIRNTKTDITLTISGGVTYPHFILGVTTPEMFEKSLESSAPFFDLEVWDYGVLHSGPRAYIKSFSYDDLYKAAGLWDKISSVTTYNNHQNIVFLYDPFVAAGAAVAFPGRSSVNCPAGWMTSGLNYNSIVTVGSWGNFHEYHHNFQGYGVGNGGEVTNNGLSLVSYALFTKISSNRKLGNYGASGLDHWGSYTSSVFALNEVNKIKYPNVNPNNGNQGLGLYACLLHNLGPDAYIKVKGAGGGQSYLNYMKKWQEVTHNNMYYYFNELLGGKGISDTANPNYPTFVPIACVYQTGRSYLYYNEETKQKEKRYIKTMRPFVIPFGKTYDIDLNIYFTNDGQYQNGSILLPTHPDKSERFTYKIKSVSNPQNGNIKKVDSYHYQYVPDENQENLSSGEIYVTLEISDTSKKIDVDDIDLILEFEMSHETLKTTLERKIYEFDQSKMYTSAIEAFENNYEGYTNVTEIEHSNPTQNCNTDIWKLPEEKRNQYPNHPEFYFIHENQIEEINCKLYFSEDRKYRIYLRGRTNLALYFSLDGNDYKLGASINKLYDKSWEFKTKENNTYFDVEFFEDGRALATTYVEGDIREYSYKLTKDKNGDIRYWVYLKEVLIDTSKGAISYIGVGSKEWTVPVFSISTTYLDNKGNVLSESTDPNIYVTWSNYSDHNGNIVAKKKSFSDSRNDEFYNKSLGIISETDFNELTKEEAYPPDKVSYANGYRSSYEFPDNKAFESDYFYKRTYGQSYVDESNPTHYMTWDDQCSLVATNFVEESKPYPIENLFKEGYDNYIHPKSNTAAGTYFTIDMGKEITANSITFHGRTDKGSSITLQGIPKDFSLFTSNDNEHYTKIGEYTNRDGIVNNENRAAKVNLDKSYTFRYVNITIASSHSNSGRVILSAIRFSHTLKLGEKENNNVIILSSDDVTLTGPWQNKVAYSSFGSVFVGTKDCKIHFEFTGTRLAALTSTKFGSNYQVLIDGNKVDSIKVKDLTSEFGITYLTPMLSNTKHTVEVTCTDEANFDSFAYFVDT